MPYLVAVIALVSIVLAIRIVAGWVIPAETMRRFDAGARRARSIYLQVMFVVIAGFFVVAYLIGANSH